MESNDLNQPLKTALDELKVYLDLQIKLNKAVFGKKAEEISSQLSLILILTGIAAFFLLMVTFGFVHWYAESHGTLWAGYLLAAGFYFLLGLIIFLFRNSLISKPLRKSINETLMENETGITVMSDMSDEKFLNKYILTVKEKIVKQEVVVKQNFENLGTVYNLHNITRQMLSNAYESLLTTTNMAKAVYFLTSKLKRKRKPKKEHKKLK